MEKLFPHSHNFAQYHQLYKNLKNIHLVDACSGAARVLRADLLKTVGGLDENFFMYGEDLDWCHRIRQAGLAIVFYPTVTITHHKYKSGIKSESIQTATQIRVQF
jgi:GT2 family glycosyltransferase